MSYYQRELIDIILTEKTSLIKDFYKQMFDNTYSLDINGYNMIFLVPGNLSGIGVSGIDLIGGNTMFFALEVNNPELTLNLSEGTGGVPHVIGRQYGNSCSVSYFDTDGLTIYNAHKTWTSYITDVVKGFIDPGGSYITNKELDYPGSIYIVKFKSDLNTPVYIGKCVGVFPTGLPTKEIIGSRTNSQITICNVNYSCAWYLEEVISTGSGGSLLSQFSKDIGSLI